MNRKKIEYTVTMNNDIFISIASYRDPTLIKTIRGALEKADNPGNIVFGLALQYHPDEQPDLSFLPSNQLRVINYDPDNRPGLTKIRYEISELHDGEEYFLMTDSHMVFMKDSWDTYAINTIKKLSEKSGHDKVVISGNFGGIQENTFVDREYYPELVNDEIVMKKKNFINSFDSDGTKRVVHIDGSTLFAKGSFIGDVGYDSHSQYILEEEYLSWRAFMRGWDAYRIKDNWFVQDPNEYFYKVWGTSLKRKYLIIDRADPRSLELEMYRSMALNDTGRYVVDNPVRSCEELWTFMGDRALNNFKQISKV